MPASLPTLGTPGLCASGTNVFIFYTITTTTTNTVITAPIVAANGPIDYVGGGLSSVTPPVSPASGTNGVSTNGAVGTGTSGDVTCVVAGSAPGSAAKRVTCPGTSSAQGVIRLLCSLTHGGRTAHIARRHAASAAARTRTTKQRTRPRAHRNVYLCKRV